MEIKVGMADLNICSAPDTITTLGLGSCIGVVVWDPVVKKCGMVHVMLPDSTSIAQNSNKAKFADTGIEEIVKLVVQTGARKERLVAKIAGGSQMFNVGKNSTSLRVGERNAEAVKKKLAELNIKLLAEDVGGTYGRTVVFNPDSGEYLIRAIGKESKVI